MADRSDADANATPSSGRRFVDRVALVTGAGHGIGRAVAERFAAEGALVVVADVDEAAAVAVADRLASAATGAAVGLGCDIHDTGSVTRCVERAVDAYGGIDVLANVAGGSLAGTSLEKTSDEDWNSVVDLNLTGAMRCIRAVLPHLRRRGGGAIVSIGSVNGLAAFGELPYSSAKAGLSVLAQNLAVQLGPDGIRVNVVAPGTIRTRVWDGQDGGADRLRPLYPLGRVGEPADIAAAVAFLASDDASWITGITLPVDGGVLAGPAHLMSRLIP